MYLETTNFVWGGTVSVSDTSSVGTVQTLYFNGGHTNISVSTAVVISQSIMYYNGTVLSNVSNWTS
jgi:hypothetical protein